MNRRSRRDNQQSRRALHRRGDHLIDDDHRRRGDEDQRHEWMSPRAQAQPEESHGHQREEDPFRVHDAREELAVRAGEDERG